MVLFNNNTVKFFYYVYKCQSFYQAIITWYRWHKSMFDIASRIVFESESISNPDGMQRIEYRFSSSHPPFTSDFNLTNYSDLDEMAEFG